MRRRVGYINGYMLLPTKEGRKKAEVKCARLLVCLLTVLSATQARVIARGAPEIIARIEVDMPLRAPSICLGPEGTYYLTGTVSTRPKEDGSPDFRENDGVYLWKSTDLETWEPLGNVFNLKEQPNSLYGPQQWLHRMQIHPDRPYRDPGFGVSSPEIHYFRDTFWIPFSMAQGTALLKSESGKPQGPYGMVAWYTVRECDPSIFVDGETVWWVFEDGRIARMKEDMTGLTEERPKLMQPGPGGGRYLRQRPPHHQGHLGRALGICLALRPPAVLLPRPRRTGLRRHGKQSVRGGR